jgi:hypothetical protein
MGDLGAVTTPRLAAITDPVAVTAMQVMAMQVMAMQVMAIQVMAIQVTAMVDPEALERRDCVWMAAIPIAMALAAAMVETMGTPTGMVAARLGAMEMARPAPELT